MAERFTEFRLGDVIPPVKVKKYAKKPTSEGNVPFISCQTTNNGIACYCGETPEIEHCITVSTNGNCFDCFWHDEPIIPSSDVEVLTKDGITDDREISLYLCSVLSPFTRFYSYSNKPKNGKVFDTVISLPVIALPDEDHVYTPDDIDWGFMRDRVKELEHDRVKELDAYLAVAGLDDCELTEDDKEVLSLGRQAESDEVGGSQDAGGLRWGEFKVTDLFKIGRGMRLTKSCRVPGSIALLTAGVGIGQGVAEYIAPVDSMTLYNDDITIDMFGGCYCHDYPHYGDDNVHFLVNDDIGTLSRLYICTALNKKLQGTYSYGKQFRMNILKDMTVSLPVAPSGEPDWDFMERYVRAQEKQVIAGVVAYKGRMLEETKKIVEAA